MKMEIIFMKIVLILLVVVFLFGVVGFWNSL